MKTFIEFLYVRIVQEAPMFIDRSILQIICKKVTQRTLLVKSFQNLTSCFRKEDFFEKLTNVLPYGASSPNSPEQCFLMDKILQTTSKKGHPRNNS